MPVESTSNSARQQQLNGISFSDGVLRYRKDEPSPLGECAFRDFVQMYLSDERRHQKRFSRMIEDPTGAAAFARAIPELLWQGRYASALIIWRTVEAWSQTDSPSSAIFEALLERVHAAIAESDLLEVLLERLRRGTTEVREQGIEVLATLGVRGISSLIELVSESEDSELRRQLSRALARSGAYTLRLVRVVLARPDLPVRVLRGLLAALAQIKSLEASNTVRRFLDHANPSVREEALAALTRIMSPHVEPEILAALTDPAARVRRHALECLRSVGNLSPQVADSLCEVVRGRRDEEPEEDDQIQIRVCQVMVEVGRTSPSLVPGFESALIEALGVDRRKKFIGGWGGTRRKSDAVRGAICTALGEIGGPMAAASLGRMLGEENLLVRDRIARAFRRLEERLALQIA